LVITEELGLNGCTRVVDANDDLCNIFTKKKASVAANEFLAASIIRCLRVSSTGISASREAVNN